MDEIVPTHGPPRAGQHYRFSCVYSMVSEVYDIPNGQCGAPFAAGFDAKLGEKNT